MAVGLRREELTSVFLLSFKEQGSIWIGQKQAASCGENPEYAQFLRDAQERLPPNAPSNLLDVFGIMLAMSFATLDTIAANNEAIAKTLSTDE
jgi:hypothetical protein